MPPLGVQLSAPPIVQPQLRTQSEDPDLAAVIDTEVWQVLSPDIAFKYEPKDETLKARNGT